MRWFSGNTLTFQEQISGVMRLKGNHVDFKEMNSLCVFGSDVKGTTMFPWHVSTDRGFKRRWVKNVKVLALK